MTEGNLHPLTLRFVDSELEREFGEERGASLGRWLERAVLFAGILWAVGTVLDLFLGCASSGVAGMAGYTLEARTRQVFQQRRIIERQQRELAREKEKSDRLLANMLPESVAARLREDPSALAESFDEVTVLFADLVGFTTMATAMPPSELVQLLDGLFSRFDELAVHHGVEKVKTIGDAYMVVGGCPERRHDHVERTVAMGLSMLVELRRFAAERGLSLTLRAGIHTGRIQVSAAVRDRLGDQFPLEERGPVSVKGKGEMLTFLVVEPG